MHTLIIGGSHGIGWELANLYAQPQDTVTITGRTAPSPLAPNIIFYPLDLSANDYANNIRQCITKLAPIDRLVYAAGYYQEGSITDLTEAQIQAMIQVCGSGFILASRAILLQQKELAECIVITSSSQWIPRQLEPIYNFAKAGVAHFAQALSLDTRIGKLLVAGPTGTKTAFHANRKIDMSTYHEPKWVAQTIATEAAGNYRYKFIKVLRDPARVETVEVH